MNIKNMKEVSVTDIDKESLVDVNDISIDVNQSIEDRLVAFIRQVKNPYCFRVGNVVVKNIYTEGTRTLNDCFSDFLNAVVR